METIIILLIILCCLFLFIGTHFYKETFFKYDTFNVGTNLMTQYISPSPNKNTSFISDIQSQVSNLITNVSNTLSNTQDTINSTQNTTPMTQMTITPMTQMTSTPMTQMTITPMTQMTSAPMTQMTITPMTQMTSAPMTQMTSAPMTQMTSTPMTQMTSTPMTQMTSTPMTQMTSTPMTQIASAPMTQIASAPITQIASAPMTQMASTSEIQKYYDVSIPNGIWDGNSAGDYTCPNANNVNTTGGNGKWSEYCIFNNAEDVQKYCNLSPSCLGYVTRGPDMFQATNNPIKDPNGGAYYKKIIGNKPPHSYNKKYISGWWDGNKPGEYTCPGAINRNIIDGNENWKNYCIFSNEIDAQNYCNLDQSCLGYVAKDTNMFQVTNNPIPDKNGGAYYQKQ
jgi:hypothetical protein